jgi:dihydrofolate reductase
MRRIILGVAVTLDGFIEGPNGEYDWCFNDQDYGLTEFFHSVDTFFMGRKTYELAKSQGDSNPAKDAMTYVFTNTIDKSHSPNVRLVRSIDEVPAIRKQPGKDIWLFGGAELTTAFINANMVDELWLSVHPILLGSGKPLFQNIDGRKNLKLTECKHYDSGLVSLKYIQS